MKILKIKDLRRIMQDEYESVQRATAITGQLVSMDELIRRFAKAIHEAE